jgi:hypothetical protein
MPKFLGELTQQGGDFALLDSSNIRGGFMQVDTLKDRDSISKDKLKKGMHVYVESEEHIYEWKGDAWVLFEVNSISSEGDSNLQFITTTQKVQEVINPVYTDNEGTVYFGIKFNDTILFKSGDIVGWNLSADQDGNISGTYDEVSYINNDMAYFRLTESSVIPDKYTTLYLVGSTSDTVRRCVLCIHPYHGTKVISQFLNLSIDNINTNYTFRLGQHGINYWKVYAEDVYFKGVFIDEKDRNISDVVSLNEESISTGLTGLRREFGYENLLNNPYFISGMDCWLTENTATYFKAAGKFIMTNKTLLSVKKDGAYVITEGGQSVLRLINGYITQRNSNLKKITNLDDLISPYYVTLIFNYKVITPGTLKVMMNDESADGYSNEEKTQYKTEQYLDTVDDTYHTFKSSFLWNGTGDFRLEYSGEIKIQTLVIKINEIKTFERKYQELFDYSDTLVRMAKSYLDYKNQ